MAFNLAWQGPYVIPNGVGCGYESSITSFNDTYYVNYRGSAHSNGDLDDRLWQISMLQSDINSKTWSKVTDLSSKTGFNSSIGPNGCVIESLQDKKEITRLALLYKGADSGSSLVNSDNQIYCSLMDTSQNWTKNSDGSLETLTIAKTNGMPGIVQANKIVYAAFQSDDSPPFTAQQVYYMVALAPKSTTTSPQFQWGYPTPIAGAGSSFGPSLAYHPYLQKIFMTYKGIEGDGAIYYSIGDPFSSPNKQSVDWSAIKKINTTDEVYYGATAIYIPNPNDATSEGVMMAIWAAHNQDDYIRYSIYDSTNDSWSTPVDVANARSHVTPSVCLSSDGKTLAMIFKGLEHGVNSTEQEAQLYFQSATISF